MYRKLVEVPQRGLRVVFGQFGADSAGDSVSIDTMPGLCDLSAGAACGRPFR